MKVVVSYLNSKYNKKKTIDLINETSADGIHIDLTDGLYAGVKNFNEGELIELFKDNNKPIDIHLMVENPSSYLNALFPLEPDCIYFHPSTEEALIGILKQVSLRSISVGIAINPSEDIKDFAHIYPYVDRVLLMSVNPGFGGQGFIDTTTNRLKELKEYQENNTFEIFVDGGINEETIQLVAGADGVVSGSYICLSDNYEERIQTLKKD